VIAVARSRSRLLIHAIAWARHAFRRQTVGMLTTGDAIYGENP